MLFGVFGSSPPSLCMSGVTWLCLSHTSQLLLLLFLARLFVSQGLFFASELREFSTAGRLGLLGDKAPQEAALRKCPGQSRLSKLSLFGENIPQN